MCVNDKGIDVICVRGIVTFLFWGTIFEVVRGTEFVTFDIEIFNYVNVAFISYKLTMWD